MYLESYKLNFILGKKNISKYLNYFFNVTKILYTLLLITILFITDNRVGKRFLLEVYDGSSLQRMQAEGILWGPDWVKNNHL